MAEPKPLTTATVQRLPFIERLDVKFVEAARPILEAPLVNKIAEIGKVGDEPPLLALSAAVAFAGFVLRKPRLQRTGIRMLVAHVVAIGAKELGKRTVDRSRPTVQLEKGEYVAAVGTSKDDDLRSFPSGHTAGALSVARAFSREYPRYLKPALTIAGTIGVLQVPRRAHYPGDVIAGAAAGIIAEKLSDFVISRITFGRDRLE